MPSSKFISIRLDRNAPPRVYVDDMKQFISPAGLKIFTLKADMTKNTAQGATITVDALRWPPEGYDSPISLALGAQWPFGTQYYDPNDASGAVKGRSFTEMEFHYDENAKTLSWNQKNDKTPGKLLGSVELNDRTPVWYVVLELDSASKGAKGSLWVDGKDITATK